MDRHPSGTRPRRSHQGAVRRRRRRREPAWEVVGLHGSEPFGPDVSGPSAAEMFAAIEHLPQQLTWEVVGDAVVPLFVRVRPYPPGAPEPLRTVVPPGVSVGFGLDIGPAFINVSAEMVEDWPVDLEGLVERAIANLARQAADISTQEVLSESVAGVPTRALQADGGLASGLVLVPEQLERLFGPQPRLYVAPMRSVLLALPATVDRDLAAWLYAEIATQDPNCLAPQAFLWTGHAMQVEALGPAAATA